MGIFALLITTYKLMTNKRDTDSCFRRFSTNVNGIELPEQFTYPFYYQPHRLTEIAAREIQEYLNSRTNWEHDFGIERYIDGSNIGKMFGVLIVKNSCGELGYLTAFSGKLSGSNDTSVFVPPIYDLNVENGFFRPEEDNISLINHKITDLENSAEYTNLKAHVNSQDRLAAEELANKKAELKVTKKDRKIRREQAAGTLDEDEFEEFKEQLKQESLKGQYEYKQLAKNWKAKLTENHTELNSFKEKIDRLKEERKNRSAALQQRLFDQYTFLNIKGETINVCEIFKDTVHKVPPAGAGDCAAPKMLQYAFKNKMTPVAMAEFWWGQSPKSEIRKHKNFYPSCRGKCEPILGFMLQGIDVEDNPIEKPNAYDSDIVTIYDDEYLAVVNKPAEFLAVPGKKTSDSVYTRMKKRYPDAEEPLIVHRLDMSTSGLMVIAKTKDIHKALQEQFINRTVKKRYVALLDGVINSSGGTIELPLRVDLEDRPRQLVCYEYGKPAKTIWKVINKESGKTRVHFYPVTGRTHQLRVHAAHPKGLNTPIVGDDLYGVKSNRLHLHAEQIEFIHPVTNNVVKIIQKPDF